ncbi:MAG: hypothetical protein OSJ22_08225 [Rikenellaceae bacterium]|nr:hypothetical protein [Rikenellaceae bacterium]
MKFIKSFNLDYSPTASSYVSLTLEKTAELLRYRVRYEVINDDRDEVMFDGSHSRTLFLSKSEIWNDSASSDLLDSLIEDTRAACQVCKYNSGEVMEVVRAVIDLFRSVR